MNVSIFATHLILWYPNGYRDIIRYNGSVTNQKFWLWENGAYYVYHHPNATPCFTVFDTTGVYI